MSGSCWSSAAGRPQTAQASGPVGLGRHRDVAVGAVPGRDPVAPPQLARHVPVPDVGQPMLPGLLEPLGQDARPARTGRLQGAGGQRPGAHEPLGLEPRLDDVAAALALADDHLVRDRRDEVAARLEVRDDGRPGHVAVHPVVARACARDRRVVGEDRGGRQVVAEAGRVVVRIVGRRDLDRARPEGAVDDVVGDDRHVPLDERDAHEPPDEAGVALVVRMDRDRGVAEDRLRPGGGDRDRGVRVGPAGGRVDEVVANGPQRPGLGRGHHLEVADARPAARTPVDERLGAVREVRLVQPLEGDADGLGRALVHRVAQAAPVERPADPTLLAEHDLARRRDERPHPLEVALAPERLAALAFPREDPVEDELGGDRGVVEAGQEQRPMTAHPGVPDHQVLDRGPLGMPEVERAGDVRRRLDDRERRQRRVGGRTRPVRGEHVRREPALVDRALDIVRRIGLRQLRHLGPRKRNGPLVQRTNEPWSIAAWRAMRSRRAPRATRGSSSRRRPRRSRSWSAGAAAGPSGSSPR